MSLLKTLLIVDLATGNPVIEYKVQAGEVIRGNDEANQDMKFTVMDVPIISDAEIAKGFNLNKEVHTVKELKDIIESNGLNYCIYIVNGTQEPTCIFAPGFANTDFLLSGQNWTFASLVGAVTPTYQDTGNGWWTIEVEMEGGGDKWSLTHDNAALAKNVLYRVLPMIDLDGGNHFMDGLNYGEITVDYGPFTGSGAYYFTNDPPDIGIEGQNPPIDSREWLYFFGQGDGSKVSLVVEDLEGTPASGYLAAFGSVLIERFNPPGAQLIWSDNFDNNNNGWISSDTTNAPITIGNGAMTINGNTSWNGVTRFQPTKNLIPTVYTTGTYWMFADIEFQDAEFNDMQLEIGNDFDTFNPEDPSADYAPGDPAVIRQVFSGWIGNPNPAENPGVDEQFHLMLDSIAGSASTVIIRRVEIYYSPTVQL